MFFIISAFYDFFIQYFMLFSDLWKSVSLYKCSENTNVLSNTSHALAMKKYDDVCKAPEQTLWIH